MKIQWNAIAWLVALKVVAAAAATPAPDYAGRWEVTTAYPGGVYVAGLELTADGPNYVGRSGYLVHDGPFPYKYAGTLQPDGLHLQILSPGDGKAFGSLAVQERKGVLSGSGQLYGVPITVVARRPKQPPATPRVITYEPKIFYGSYSAANPPALRIFSGDTVRTKTLDANGHDEHDVAAAVSGNPLTGPFYVEGAMVGDTIAVHFNSIRPNRDTAFQNRGSLSPGAVPPGYRQQRPQNWSNLWILDRVNGTARPDGPSEKLKGYQVRLVPMLGSVGTAPIGDSIIDSAELGRFGGNLDYNEIREGVTLYLPVYQAGAMLEMGDGHAMQADGEITGQGLETSMDVEFTVTLIRDELLDQPWAENDRYIMVSGIGGSLQAAQQNATAGLSNWLISHYRLDSGEVATVLATSIRYDIAEVVDPEVHVVARIGKDVLALLPRQARPKAVVCSGSCEFE
ncbi:MAG TPA: acetamidase/formamidase family protein [Steroidobacteraceae bacterium]|nr:acetamidase/formamidase family protein [Steroidobacteraceae bacterium]